jgi:hypothetical protein
MIEPIIVYVLGIIAVEAITEIVVDSELFRPIKLWAFKETPIDLDRLNDKQLARMQIVLIIKSRISYLVNCGYCSSVWVSGMVCLFSMSYISLGENPVFEWLLLTFSTHRLSNWLHVLYEYVRRGRVLTYDVTYKSGSAVDQDE